MSQIGEGGIFSDFMTRGDLERVVHDLDINVPDAPHDPVYDEMLLTDARNKVYKPFLHQLHAQPKARASNFYKDMRTKDVLCSRSSRPTGTLASTTNA